MRTIIITAAALLSLSAGAFASADSDPSTYISGQAQSMQPIVQEGSASMSVPVAATDGSDFVQTLRDR